MHEEIQIFTWWTTFSPREMGRGGAKMPDASIFIRYIYLFSGKLVSGWVAG